MALGTIASRLTGFLRVIAMAAALGISLPDGVADPYNLANTTPNIVYELLLGGVLTSVVVPLLVQAAHDDEDGGDTVAQLLLSLVVVVLGVAVAVGLVAAPLLAALLGTDPGPERELTTTWLRFFLPQIAFYGVGATITAILNTRRRFGVPMAAPILNNLVVIATALIFITLDGPRPPTAAGLTTTQLTVLGIGTTLGVVVMTAALLPTLRATGFRWRWRFGRHPALRRAARLASWVFVYVVANQIALLVILRLAKRAVDGGATAYQYGFLLFQLPHAVVTVSVVTALLPRMSADAVTGDLAAVRVDLARAARLVAVVLVPAAFAYVVLGPRIAQLVFQYGVTSADQAQFAGHVLTAFACGLLSFSAFHLLLRVSYALQDSRTPALINIASNTVNVVVDLALFAALDGRNRVVGLAAGHAVAYTVGTLLLGRQVRRRLGGIGAPGVLRTVVRAAVAAAIGALGAWGTSRLLVSTLGTGQPAVATAVVGALVVGGFLYVVSARRMRVRELEIFANIVRGALRRSPGRPSDGTPEGSSPTADRSMLPDE